MCFSSAQRVRNNSACLNVKQITALDGGILEKVINQDEQTWGETVLSPTELNSFC